MKKYPKASDYTLSFNYFICEIFYAYSLSYQLKLMFINQTGDKNLQLTCYNFMFVINQKVVSRGEVT